MPRSRSSLPPSPLVPSADMTDKPEADKSGSAHDAQMRATIETAINKALADLGLDDADARSDLADLRDGLVSLR